MTTEEAIEIVQGIEKFFVRDKQVREALGIVLYIASQDLEPQPKWYVEKWKEKHNRWEYWDESTSLARMLWTCIFLRMHGHHSRIGRYGR